MQLEFFPKKRANAVFFSMISFPCGIGLEITALAFIRVVIPQTLQFSKLGLTCMFFRRRNFVRRHFSLQRAGIIFAPVFGFRGESNIVI